MQYALGPFIVRDGKRGIPQNAHHQVAQFYTEAAQALPIERTAEMAPGFVIVAFEDHVAVPSEYFVVAKAAAMSQAALNAKAKSAWERFAGFLPSGLTLADAIVETWGSQSDPLGIDRPKPCMPAIYDRHLAMPEMCLQHSLEPGGLILPRMPFYPFGADGSMPHISFNRIRSCIQHEMGKLLDQDEQLGRKVLGAMACDYLGEMPGRVHEGNAAKVFAPARHQSIRPKKPETKYTRTFSNEANNNTISGWTEYGGASAADRFEIINGSGVSNKNTAAEQVLLTQDAALSSPDHFAEAAVTFRGASSGGAGVAVRVSSGSHGCYRCQATNLGDDWSVVSMSGGLLTPLLVQLRTFDTQEYTFRGRANGSNISVILGSLTLTVADTTRTTETRCGLGGLASMTAGNNHYWRNWRAQDFSGGQPAVQLINGGGLIS